MHGLCCYSCTTVDASVAITSYTANHRPAAADMLVQENSFLKYLSSVVTSMHKRVKNCFFSTFHFHPYLHSRMQV